MKLIYAIVNNEDSHNVSIALTKAGYFATKLSSSGGFLKAGNNTFLICSEDSQVGDIIEIIKSCSSQRSQFIPAINTEVAGQVGGSFPIEVTVGGATIFVTDIERFEKV
ncbi:MAG: cyclic-di-AMP receptor [Oscillospiraceae bacterium]|nr:cyclic-di-AMP receptor [Oscillospiraceae bacterium]